MQMPPPPCIFSQICFFSGEIPGENPVSPLADPENRAGSARGRAASPGEVSNFPDLPEGKRVFHQDFHPKKSKSGKNARWRWHLQIHHPRRPGVPTPKIPISESKNGFPKVRQGALRSRNRAVWICGNPFFLSPIAATGWIPLSSNIIIGHTTFSGEPRLRRRGLCEIPT